MTISFAKRRADAADYYVGSDGTRESATIGPPRWYAATQFQGFEALGIRDGESFAPDHADAVRLLARGRHPATQQPLVRNAANPRRIALVDWTFSPPKSVSVVWGLSPPPLARLIEEAQHRSARAALDLMGRAAVSRQGRGGRLRTPAGLIGASFSHPTSRSLDPQLHTHLILFNLSARPDGSTGALEMRQMLAWQGAAGCLYAAGLAHALSEVGFTLRRSGYLFELAEIPERVIHTFSTRHNEAAALAHASLPREGRVADVRTASRAELRRAVYITRPKKQAFDLQALKARWHRRAWQEFGFRLEDLFDTLHARARAHRLERWDEARIAARTEEIRESWEDWRRAPSRDRPAVPPPRLHAELFSALMGQADPAQLLAQMTRLRNRWLAERLTGGQEEDGASGESGRRVRMQ